MKRCLLAIAIATSLLAACGGGGGTKTLVVDFAYPVSGALLWRDTALEIQGVGLEGNAPSCSIVSGSLPAGLSLAAAGCRVSGVPTEVRRAEVVIRLTVPGFEGQIDKAVMFETVGPPLSYNLPLTERRGVPVSSVPTSTYLGTLDPWTARPGETLHYGIASGTLPGGLQVDALTGEVHGILNETAIRSFAVQATVRGPRGTVTATSQGHTLNTVTEGLQFFYGPNDQPLNVPAGAALDLPPRVNFGFYLDPSKYGFGTYRLAAGSPPLPAGLALNATSGHLTGTPATPGSVDLLFEVALSAEGQTAWYPSSALNLTVTAP